MAAPKVDGGRLPGCAVAALSLALAACGLAALSSVDPWLLRAARPVAGASGAAALVLAFVLAFARFVRGQRGWPPPLGSLGRLLADLVVAALLTCFGALWTALLATSGQPPLALLRAAVAAPSPSSLGVALLVLLALGLGGVAISAWLQVVRSVAHVLVRFPSSEPTE